jgi:hypothetical protein
MYDFSGETFKGFEVLYFSLSATTTQLLSGSEFCKLCYDTIPVQSASANVLFLYLSLSLSPTALQPGVGLGLLQEFPPSAPV